MSTIKERRNYALQSICRTYLSRIRNKAERHGLGTWVDNMIAANKRKECNATKSEVDLLARLCDEERVSRREVPDIIGTSYRSCVEDGTFERIRRLRPKGIYSKVDVIIEKEARNG